MQLTTLQRQQSSSPAVLLDDFFIDLRACGDLVNEARSIPTSVRGILEAGEAAMDAVRRVRDVVAEASDSKRGQLHACTALVPIKEAILRAPVPDTRFILACGMNYHQHLKEMGGNAPERPLAFAKSVHTVVGPDAPIVLPDEHADMVDWEVEFSAVIGKPCHNVSQAEALDYVAGYTLVNDVSARNWVQRFDKLAGMSAIEGWDRNLLGKQFPTFCPMGPTLVTKDEVPNPDSVQIQLKVNDQMMQSACTDDLVFSISALIHYFSRFYTFLPGDVITTGSPAGVGFGRKPAVFLKPGDVVSMSADGIGTMKNPVVRARHP